MWRSVVAEIWFVSSVLVASNAEYRFVFFGRGLRSTREFANGGDAMGEDRNGAVGFIGDKVVGIDTHVVINGGQYIEVVDGS